MGREKPHGGFEPPLIWICLILIQNGFFSPLPSKHAAHLRTNPLYVYAGIQQTVEHTYYAILACVVLCHLDKHKEEIIFFPTLFLFCCSKNAELKYAHVKHIFNIPNLQFSYIATVP